MHLTAAQARFLLLLIKEKYGDGYVSEDVVIEEDGSQVGQLQAKLSIMLQAAREREKRS